MTWRQLELLLIDYLTNDRQIRWFLQWIKPFEGMFLRSQVKILSLFIILWNIINQNKVFEDFILTFIIILTCYCGKNNAGRTLRSCLMVFLSSAWQPSSTIHLSLVACWLSRPVPGHSGEQRGLKARALRFLNQDSQCLNLEPRCAIWKASFETLTHDFHHQSHVRGRAHVWWVEAHSDDGVQSCLIHGPGANFDLGRTGITWWWKVTYVESGRAASLHFKIKLESIFSKNRVILWLLAACAHKWKKPRVMLSFARFKKQLSADFFSSVAEALEQSE